MREQERRGLTFNKTGILQTPGVRDQGEGQENGRGPCNPLACLLASSCLQEGLKKGSWPGHALEIWGPSRGHFWARQASIRVQ